ncbi:predicted protein [Chaetomium globosum CBS 148.51]|uniref:Uncharacterized protein n=1 Tax=Chaetomium globosum (strain ATCC 6205 / CBS 148.51 / DSM 1962 / NBRC 6347 / NRRL 1970) TaxID=306901 RepID=Q2GRT0_CHAGB|nr:uncharacterized protein CHGG_09324 [Chaetomium globosum CBS 148.51]EAQ85310.1 predicted protein [Chaetomium globosum CBS 148.51]
MDAFRFIQDAVPFAQAALKTVEQAAAPALENLGASAAGLAQGAADAVAQAAPIAHAAIQSTGEAIAPALKVAAEQGVPFAHGVVQSAGEAIAPAFKIAAEQGVPFAHNAVQSVGEAIAPALQIAAEAGANGYTFAAANPAAVACGAVALGGLAIVAAPGILTGPALSAAGFTPLGPGAGRSFPLDRVKKGVTLTCLLLVVGTIAAMVQTPNVVAGGVFATLQSAGMGGYGAAVVAAAGQAVGGTVAAAGGAGVVLSNMAA